MRTLALLAAMGMLTVLAGCQSMAPRVETRALPPLPSVQQGAPAFAPAGQPTPVPEPAATGGFFSNWNLPFGGTNSATPAAAPAGATVHGYTPPPANEPPPALPQQPPLTYPDRSTAAPAGSTWVRAGIPSTGAMPASTRP